MEIPKEVREYMSQLGQRSAASLTPEQRVERAKKANQARKVNRAIAAKAHELRADTERPVGTNN